jgi:hypothetical protein
LAKYTQLSTEQVAGVHELASGDYVRISLVKIIQLFQYYYDAQAHRRADAVKLSFLTNKENDLNSMFQTNITHKINSKRL